MNPDTDFKTLWSRQETTGLSDFRVVLTKAMRSKKKMRNRLMLLNAVLIATVIAILWIVFYSHPRMITTKIGVVFVILPILLYIVSSGSILTTLYKSNPEKNTMDYLKQLIWIKRRNEFIHRTVFTLYFIFLSAGIILYMLEYVQTYSLFGQVLSYGIVVIWIAFNWFYTRKRRIAKERTEVNQMISKLEELSGQMTEE